MLLLVTPFLFLQSQVECQTSEALFFFSRNKFDLSTVGYVWKETCKCSLRYVEENTVLIPMKEVSVLYEFLWISKTNTSESAHKE